MSHALVQRMSINLCRPFLRTLDFACRPYPQCVSELHEVVVLSCTLVLLSLWVGNLEPNSRHFLIGHLTGGFPLCSTTRNLFTHWDSCSVLDAISLIGGFLTFVSNFPYWLLFRGSFSCTACIWCMRKMHRVIGS
jgi:hypothetical protein